MTCSGIPASRTDSMRVVGQFGAAGRPRLHDYQRTALMACPSGYVACTLVVLANCRAPKPWEVDNSCRGY